jgi:hypothetical protein
MSASKWIWIIIGVVVGGAILLPVAIWVFIAGAFILHDVTKKATPSAPAGPPPPPPVKVSVPQGGFRPAPSTVPTQPSFDELVRRARQYDPATTQADK